VRIAANLDLASLEWLSGRWPLALEHAIEALELAELARVESNHARALLAAALVEAHLGRIEDARAKAEQALAWARSATDEITAIDAFGVLGHIDLALGNAEAAADLLGDLPARLISLGWDDPSSPLWADAVESLIACGDLERAETCKQQYEERAARASRRSITCAQRCRGLLAAAQGADTPAIEALESSAAELAALPYPFEHGRTLLALGRVRRRALHRRAAHEALEHAVTILDGLGAQLWAESARSELKRIGGRKAAYDELTAAELRVASLAAEGRSNKEIASTEFLSVRTVEAHLYRVYRKLGVRSRTALSRRLPPVPASTEEHSAPKVQ
jgi:DNA-binding CsgD family transcriptional regulator